MQLRARGRAVRMQCACSAYAVQACDTQHTQYSARCRGVAPAGAAAMVEVLTEDDAQRCRAQRCRLARRRLRHLNGSCRDSAATRHGERASPRKAQHDRRRREQVDPVGCPNGSAKLLSSKRARRGRTEVRPTERTSDCAAHTGEQHRHMVQYNGGDCVVASSFV